MDYNRDVVLINSSEIINIVRRTLSKIDSRLVNHGERVGYLAKKIYEAGGCQADVDLSKLFILCILHDIGAYKTDEIDKMVMFETNTPFDHAFYGYLFLKHASNLSEYAEAILYHHTNYTQLQHIKSSCDEYAGIIHLADRADILLTSDEHDLSVLQSMSGTSFYPHQVEALLRADKQHDLTKKIISGAYEPETLEYINSLSFSNQDIMDYLKFLVYAIDFRSSYTVTHTADTTIISLETGKLFGLSPSELQVLYTGAFLHDIGKIAIPSTILEKPDKLTTDEYVMMKQHIAEGEEILRGVVSDDICNIALRHHEKLDGSGYPLGLTAESLTLPQRIVAVADILSALYQQRSYKASFPKERVIAILTEMRDKGQLCPYVVNTVCDNYDQILKRAAESHDQVKTLYDNMMHEYVTNRKTY